MAAERQVFLVDNGSLRPEATLGLRELAEALTRRSGLRVRPVSLLHSHKVDPEALGGRPARIVRPTLAEAIGGGCREFVMLPLFLGPSRALTEYLPRVVGEVTEGNPAVRVRIAAPLAGDDPDEPDPALARMVADHVGAARSDAGEEAPERVALVDHGTPEPAVNRVREAVAGQLAECLGMPVTGCSMERREGPEYAFNEPLLESLGGNGGVMIAAMFFLLPGRHAGKNGDVAEICRGLEASGAFSRVVRTPLLAEHPDLVSILDRRLRECLERAEVRC